MVELTEPRISIGDLVEGPAVVIEAKTTLRAVAKMLGDLGIGMLVVVDDGMVVGVVSERDLVWAIARDADLDVVWAVDVMTPDPVSAPPATPVVEAAAAMIAGNVRHILVDYPEAPGVVSIRDVVAEFVSD